MNPAALYIAIGTGVAAVTAGVVIFADELGFGSKDPASAPPVAALTAPAPDSNGGDAPSKGTEVASLPSGGDVQVDGTKADPEASVEVIKSKPPTFDIVRVEPDGQTLVAGKSEPGAKVDLKNGDEVISSAVADGNGDWVIVLEESLKPGVSDLSLSAMNGEEAVQSESNVTVALPEDGSGELLVMETVPGEASKIIAKIDPPKTEAPAKTEEVAKVEAPIAPKPDVAQKVEEVVETVEEVAKTETVVEAPAEVKTEVAKVAEVEAPAAVKEPEKPAEVAPEKAVPAVVATSKPAPVEKNEEVVAKVEEPTVAPVEKTEPAVSLTVSIEAVEIEGDTLFVAGAAEPAGSSLRLYVNNKAIADSRSGETGRFLFDGKLKLQPGEHSARVDLLDAKSGSVAKRAEVVFVKSADSPVLSVRVRDAAIDASKGGLSGSAQSASLQTKKVIIRRGDNLWTIARRVYGAGIRYSTIYDTNTDQIRDPHWIYPGQVFELPHGEADWDHNFEAVEAPGSEEKSADAGDAVAQ